MGLASIMKVNKYKRFSFTPRYYDERKEHRDELIRELNESKLKQAGGDVEFKSHLQTGFLKSKRVAMKRENNTSTYRFLVILGLLGVFFYWLLR